jgi:hypothetical protein
MLRTGYCMKGMRGRTCGVHKRHWSHVQDDIMDGTPAVLSSNGQVLLNSVADYLQVSKVEGRIHTNCANMSRQLRRRVLLDVAVHICMAK